MAGAVSNLMVRAGFDGSQLTRGLQQMQGNVRSANDSVNRSMQSLSNSTKTISNAIHLAYAKIAASIGSIGVSYDAMQESSTVAWTTLLGTQEKAKKQIQDIANFAKNTQFDTEGVDAMAKYLNNAGYEGQKLFDQLNRVADVSGAFNITADNAKEMVRQMSQVDQAQVAYTADLDILQNQGIPIFKAIAAELGTNVAGVRKMASQGKITSDIYDKAFNNIANTVKGSSAKQAQTFNGMISTMKDDFSILMGVLEKPIFNALHDGMTKLLPVMDILVSLGRGDMGSFKQSLDSTFGKSGASIVLNFIDNLKQGMSQIGGYVDKAKQAITGIFDIFKGGQALGTGINLLSSLGFKADQIYQIEQFINTVKSDINGFTQWVSSTFSNLFSGKNDIGSSFNKIFNTIKSIALPILTDIIDFVQHAIKRIKEFWDKDGDTIIQAVKDAIKTLSDTFEALKPVLEKVWDIIKTVGIKVFNDFMDVVDFLGGKMNWIIPILGGVVAGIAAFKIIESITNLVRIWREASILMTAAQWLLNIALDANPIGLVALAIGGLVTAGILLYQNWDTVSSKMSSIWTKIEQGAAGMVNGIIGGLNWMIKEINKVPGVNIPLIGQVSWGGIGSGTTFQVGQAQSHNHGQAYAYADGTGAHPGGPAVVGDGTGSNAGSELFMLPNGKMGLTPSSPTLMNLPKGTQVINAKDTKGLLNGLIPAYANGTISNAISEGWNWLKDKISGIKDLAINNLGNFGTFASLPKALISTVGGNLFNYIKNNVFGGNNGAVSGNVSQWLMQAMAIAGAPASWLGPLSTLVQHESGGNPNAINLWDSNAKAGHPSKGLFQTIDSTFNAYAIKGLGDIYNPIANAVAGIRYIMDRYGSVFNVPGIKSMMSGGAYKGYASGTNSAIAGWHMVGEEGPELMYVPGGAQIKNNRDTNKMLGGTQKTYNVTVNTLKADMNENDLVRALQRMEALNYV